MKVNNLFKIKIIASYINLNQKSEYEFFFTILLFENYTPIYIILNTINL
jgi:hypothetical protein